MSDIHGLTLWVLTAFFVASFALGMLTHRTHFCTMGAIADVVNMQDWTRARQWLLAIGVGMVGFASLTSLGLIDGSKTVYATTRFGWLSDIVGGLMFGYGMVIASGCGNRALVRIGGGNLKSLVVLLVLGISAFATMKGITGVLRVNTVDTVAVEMASGANLQALGIPGLGFVVGAFLIVGVLRHKDFWTANNLFAGVGVGLILTLIWWISGHLAFVAEHPETLEAAYLASSSGRIEALSFVAPVALTLDWLMFYSDQSKVLNIGIASVAGIIVGAWVSAITSQKFRWEGFANPDDLRNHLIGAVLMGVGGVTAMGCTFGQGLSGVATLSLNSFVAIAAIVVGCVAGLRRQAARL